jgi:PiT family inorganic phosphate transporter
LDPAFILIGGSTIAIAFYVAWSIGANDVANSMGTSVGSRAITIKQAILIAGIFEFAGAVLIGIHVTKTIQHGILDPEIFSADPNIYIYGMLAALLAAAIWISISTYFALPISTSQSIVGALLGFGVVAAGISAVSWGKIIQIGESWILSPLVGAALAFFIFFIIKKVIFDTNKPFESTKKALPFFTFALISVIIFTIFKSLECTDFPTVGFTTVLGITLGVSVISAILSHVLVNRYKPGKLETDYDVYHSIEHVFIYLQIITACFVAFAHGSNDVANAIGPLAAIVNLLQSGAIEEVIGVPL